MSSVSATTPLDLSHLNELAGNDTADLGDGFESPFAPSTAYPVEIAEQKLVTTQKGLTQLVLTLQQLKASGSGVKGSLRITLPLFSQAAKDNYPEQTLTTIKSLNAKVISELLLATHGDQLANTDHAALGKIVIGFAKSLTLGEVSFVGAKCFYYRVPGKKGGDKTFDHFSAEQPTEVPLAA